MAVTIIPVRTRLQLRLQVGLDEKGNPKFGTKSYTNLKPDADNEQLYQLGQTLAGLQEHYLEAIRRVDEVELEVS
ncbi:MAG TPA: DUF1659 domain-containing protein [Firmicutes bacterium]|nr:DUF1659 domain-containing protein [Bacillota bacterium]